MLLALLRKRLAEFDATSSDTRLVLSRDQIVEMLRLYLPPSTNEARLVDNIDTHINRVVEMGFLRKLRGPGRPLRSAAHHQGLRRRAVAVRLRRPPGGIPGRTRRPARGRAG